MGRQLKILFASDDLARSCNDDSVRTERYGPALAATIRRRLCEVNAVTHLGELRRLPGARLRRHPARNDGSMLISLGPAADFLVHPRDDPPPTLLDGGLDEARVRTLVVLAIAIAS
ncbi:hypothetical protein ACF1GY_05545 [Streptomyces sp. NPDC014684]|uniref:hypothetical protein n=1 Tax=Streptomyces sp. NPDC014684 TaxID=3364880 RepID=UPI0037030592